MVAFLFMVAYLSTVVQYKQLKNTPLRAVSLTAINIDIFFIVHKSS